MITASIAMFQEMIILSYEAYKRKAPVKDGPEKFFF